MSERKADLSHQETVDQQFNVIENLRKNYSEDLVNFQKLLKLEARKHKLMSRKSSASEAFPRDLVQKKRFYQSRSTEIKGVCFHIVAEFIKQLKTHLLELLSCNSEELVYTTDHATKEAYKIYGLLLSTCDLKKRKDEASFSEIIVNVYQSLPNKYQVPFIEGHIKQAVALTYDMLTLLPPLIVCQPHKYLGGDVQDTHRQTWDEKESHFRLVYYRPVLVYGNHLHVAVTGHVGKRIESSSAVGRIQSQASAQNKQRVRNSEIEIQAEKTKKHISDQESTEPDIVRQKCDSKRCEDFHSSSRIWNIDGNNRYRSILLKIHEECLKCQNSLCESDKLLDPNTSGITFYCGQIYCPDHHYCVKCQKCTSYIDTNEWCNGCCKSLQKDIFRTK